MMLHRHNEEAKAEAQPKPAAPEKSFPAHDVAEGEDILRTPARAEAKKPAGKKTR